VRQSERAVLEYRIYSLTKDDHITGAPTVVVCKTDDEAVMQAKKVLDGVRPEWATSPYPSTARQLRKKSRQTLAVNSYRLTNRPQSHAIRQLRPATPPFREQSIVRPPKLDRG
jgi:hypothetical protein